MPYSHFSGGIPGGLGQDRLSVTSSRRSWLVTHRRADEQMAYRCWSDHEPYAICQSTMALMAGAVFGDRGSSLAAVGVSSGRAPGLKQLMSQCAGVVELADTQDLKSHFQFH
jgi:hypothetical protein